MDSLSVSRPEESASVEEVMQRLEDLVRPYSADITSIRLFCHKNNRDSMLCSVNASANAPAIATAIGGIVFGFSLACRNVFPLKDDFRCPNRQGETFLMPSCSQCGREVSRKPAAARVGLRQQPPDGRGVAQEPDRESAREPVHASI